ncbi:MAG TPA: hypothetical protein VHO06_02345 [Polyangia bacterium]|nr:hypothetical protein [Polyangia bacterium]
MRTRLEALGRRARPALLPALALGTLLGCTSGGAASSTTTISPDTLAVDLATAFCDCGPAGGTADGGAATTRDAAAPADGGASSCLNRATLSAEQQLSLVSTAFTEGLLTIDPSVSSTCTAAYKTAGCPAAAGQDGPDVQAALADPDCANLFVGYIPIGERCDMTAECVSTGFCLSQGTGQPVTSILGSGSLGTCFPYQQVDDPCNTTADCQPPATCSATTFTCE